MVHYLRDNRSNLVGEVVNGQHEYYDYDGLGSLVGYTNSSGTLIQSYTYNEWGVITGSSSSLALWA